MDIDYKTAKGWLRDDERQLLHDLAAYDVGHRGCVVNIGVEYGASLACIRAGNAFCRIIAVDLDMSKLVPEVYLACKPLLVEGDSAASKTQSRVEELVRWEALERPQSGVSLLFVDGDHSYDGVMSDTWYCGLVHHGGLVVFHDCRDYDNPHKGCLTPITSAVAKAVSDWFKIHDNEWFEVIDLPKYGTMRVFRRK